MKTFYDKAGTNFNFIIIFEITKQKISQNAFDEFLKILLFLYYFVLYHSVVQN